MQHCNSEASLNIAPSAQADLLYLSVSFQRRCQPALNTRRVVFVMLELLCFFLGASPSARSTTTTDPTPEEMEVAIVIDLCQTSGFRQALVLNRLIPFCWQGSTDRKIQLGCGKERVQLNSTLALWSLGLSDDCVQTCHLLWGVVEISARRLVHWEPVRLKAEQSSETVSGSRCKSSFLNAEWHFASREQFRHVGCRGAFRVHSSQTARVLKCCANDLEISLNLGKRRNKSTVYHQNVHFLTLISQLM